MKPMNGLTAWVGATALVFATAACQNTANGMKKDAEENRRESAAAAADARQKADEASDAAARAADRAKDSADRAGDRAADAADRAGTSMSRATDSARESSRDAKERTSDATHSLGRTADAAVQTMDVKSALVADKRVDASGINVDTDAATKTVTLKGHVPTAAQKTIAAEIARDKAEGYKITNDLRVGKD